MAGSIKFISYITNLGDAFALKCDESNAEAVGSTDLTTTLDYELPRNVKPRYAVYQSADGLTVRKCYLTGTDTVAPATITDSLGAGTLNLVRVVAEQYRAISPADTGLIDGDAT